MILISEVQVANWVKLKFAAMNLKKFAKWKWQETYSLLRFLLAYFLDAQNPVYRSCVARVSRQTGAGQRKLSRFFRDNGIDKQLYIM